MWKIFLPSFGNLKWHNNYWLTNLTVTDSHHTDTVEKDMNPLVPAFCTMVYCVVKSPVIGILRELTEKTEIISKILYCEHYFVAQYSLSLY